MTKQIKKAVCLISAALLTVSMAACGGNKPINSSNSSAQGGVTSYIETEIGADAGIVSPATAEIDPEGNLVVYDRGRETAVYDTLDKDGKKVDEVKCDFAGDGSIFTIGPDGSLYIVVRSGGDREASMSFKYLVYDKDGKKISETDLGSITPDISKGMSPGFSAIAVDKDGSAYIANSQTGIAVYDRNGSKIRDIDVKDCVSLDFDKDGKLVTSNIAFSQFKQSVEKLDPASGASIWTQEIKSKARNITPSFGRIRCSKTDGSIYLFGDSQIERFDANGKQQDAVLHFMDYSILASGYEASDFVTILSGGFVVITTAQGPRVMKTIKGGPSGDVPGGAKGSISNNANGNVAVNKSENGSAFGDTPAAISSNSPSAASSDSFAPAGFSIYRYDPDTSGKSAEKKKEIHLTLSRSNRFIETAISTFQKANPDYRIIPTYYEDQSGDDQDNVIKTLNTSILSGNGPDIISVSELPFQKYGEKNILVDIDKLMKNDKSYDMSKYYSNIIDAVRTNGSLYAMPISYGFSALIANKSILDQNKITVEDTKWTWDDFKAIAQRINEGGGGIKALPQMKYTDLLDTVMQGNYSKFVDPIKKSNTFNSPEFYSILSMVKSFSDASSTIRGGKGMLSDEAVNRGAVAFMPWNIGDYIMYSMMTSMAGGHIELLNYPSDGGSGKHSFTCGRDSIFSINRNSKYIDKAWEFIKLLLSDEQQSSSRDLNGFSVSKAGLKASAEEAMSMTTSGNVMMNINGVEIKPAPLTQEGIDKINGFIGNLNSYSNYDGQIANIAIEELKAYFEGDKPVEQVCKLIQDRVNTYLGE